MPKKSTTGSSDSSILIDKALLRQEIQAALASFLHSQEQTMPFATKNSALQIPLSIFDSSLGVLESLVKYLRETGYTYKEIGILLKKDNKVCWSVYHKAVDKSPKPFEVLEEYVPVTLFNKEGLSCFQSAVITLHDDFGISFKRISGMLGRDYKTIYTTYRRVRP